MSLTSRTLKGNLVNNRVFKHKAKRTVATSFNASESAMSALSVSSRMKHSLPENPLFALLVPYRVFFREILGYYFFTDGLSEPCCRHLWQKASKIGLLASNELEFERKLS
jgi:hypothetical protein